LDKVGQSTRAKQKAFLEALAILGTIDHAAKAVRMSRSTHYRWLEENETYVNAVDDVLESYRDSIRAEVHRRAIDGWQEPVVYQG
jgi:molybdenum-dependent DNA-binding transcriptional regulator ModE